MKKELYFFIKESLLKDIKLIKKDLIINIKSFFYLFITFTVFNLIRCWLVFFILIYFNYLPYLWFYKIYFFIIKYLIKYILLIFNFFINKIKFKNIFIKIFLTKIYNFINSISNIILILVYFYLNLFTIMGWERNQSLLYDSLTQLERFLIELINDIPFFSQNIKKKKVIFFIKITNIFNKLQLILNKYIKFFFLLKNYKKKGYYKIWKKNWFFILKKKINLIFKIFINKIDFLIYFIYKNFKYSLHIKYFFIINKFKIIFIKLTKFIYNKKIFKKLIFLNIKINLVNFLLFYFNFLKIIYIIFKKLK